MCEGKLVVALGAVNEHHKRIQDLEEHVDQLDRTMAALKVKTMVSTDAPSISRRSANARAQSRPFLRVKPHVSPSGRDAWRSSTSKPCTLRPRYLLAALLSPHRP